jgi:hypothetical protein
MVWKDLSRIRRHVALYGRTSLPLMTVTSRHHGATFYHLNEAAENFLFGEFEDCPCVLPGDLLV